MKNNTAAKRIGLVSVACSLAFWLWACIFLFTPLNHSEWVLHVMVAFGLWLALWAMGFLLGLAAAAMGSRRWLVAALFALVSCGAAAWLVSGIQW
jgi:hypothetical protein